MTRAILFHFLCIKHVSDINISIIRSVRKVGLLFFSYYNDARSNKHKNLVEVWVTLKRDKGNYTQNSKHSCSKEISQSQKTGFFSNLNTDVYIFKSALSAIIKMYQ